VNSFWVNESFHNYADYAMSSEFREGLQKLRSAGHARRCAIMCAEAVWWRCHRRIIADYLIAAGETVLHILGPGRTELARSTEAAVPGPSGVLVYSASLDRQRWEFSLRIRAMLWMSRTSTIVGYRQDEEKNWVAELSCGHSQHMLASAAIRRAVVGNE
jgi:hypothetical protein